MNWTGKMHKWDEVSPAEVFTPEMVEEGRKYPKGELLEKVIMPNLSEITRRAGKIKDPGYWAFALDFVIKGIIK